MKNSVLLLFLMLLLATSFGCGAVARSGRSVLYIPPPIVPTGDVVGCAYHYKPTGRKYIAPQYYKVVAHNNNSAFLLFEVDGCQVVEQDINGNWVQVYTLPGKSKTFRFYSYAGAEVEIRANAYCPIAPSYQTGEEIPRYMPGTNPPAGPANDPNCSEGQYLGTDYVNVRIYPHGRWETDSWQINYPGAVKLGLRR